MDDCQFANPRFELTSAQLALALILAVNGQNFGSTPDKMRNGQQVANFPSIDIAVIAFPADGSPVAANVLFSRDYQSGIVADIRPSFGEVRDVHYLADQIDSEGKFVAPYPASLIKLMVLVGVAREVDAGRAAWSALDLRREITLRV